MARLILDHKRQLGPLLIVSCDDHVVIVWPVRFVGKSEAEEFVHIFDLHLLIVVSGGGGKHVSLVEDHLVVRIW